jgi:hypothetical protein
MSYMVDPKAAAISDVESLVNEGGNPAELAREGGKGPDEALINAMGQAWVIRAAGGSKDDETSESAWERLGLPWCREYNRAYYARAAELVEVKS